MRKAECVQSLERDMSKPIEWTEDEMRTAKLVHGPDRMNSDTYRLHLEGVDGKEGKISSAL